MKARATQNAGIIQTENGWRLGIQKGDSQHYRDAQLDDYSGLSRHKFPHQGLSLSLRAKTSSASLPGTWGFGLWNDPFGLSLGFGGTPFRLPALPNAVWFFYGSKENYLSFKEGQPQGFAPKVPANGFMAQVFSSRSKVTLPLMMAGLAFPFSKKALRKLLSKIINEDSTTISVDVTQWHRYRLEWSPTRVLFYVDDSLAFESPVSPYPPLGVILWMDNQYASFSPEGKIRFGVLEGKEEWLEIEELEIKEKNP